MGPWPSPTLPGDLREMERVEGEEGQLLHMHNSHRGMLAAFIQQGGGSPHHNNGIERRKKKYLMPEERLKWTQFSAQKILKATRPPQRKIKQTRTVLRKFSSTAGYKLHQHYGNQLHLCTLTTNYPNEKTRRQLHGQ